MKRYEPMLTWAEYSGERDVKMSPCQDGEYVKAEVAQALYDALKKFCGQAELKEQIQDSMGHLTESYIDGIYALSLADGESE